MAATKTKQPWTLQRVLPWLLIVGGIIGALCAAILTADKVTLIQHPNTHLNCDLNPIVACGSVIVTPQASAFGFMNTFIGMIGFGGVALVGGSLLAGGVFKRWYWRCFQAGVLFGVGFVTWLQFETIYRIHALCPYCMVVWSVMIPIFIYTTVYNLRQGNLPTPVRLKRLVGFVDKHHLDVLIGWYLIIFLAILTHFWYYWKTVI
ncbi:MAG TPA: vitamin K epoxide reductase family protein [Candidatus Saccharimonadales bacterium]|nr:vitamin K epoxide reductase family protein [Candidatus Saccharimonadales bacterium]